MYFLLHVCILPLKFSFKHTLEVFFAMLAHHHVYIFPPLHGLPLETIVPHCTMLC